MAGLIRTQQLCKTYGTGENAVHALLPCDLKIMEGETVAIARALSARPELLLCDEPTGNLDSATGREVIRLLHDVSAESGIALVLVTHDREVASTAQRVLTIADGQVGGDLYAC